LGPIIQPREEIVKQLIPIVMTGKSD